MSKRIDISNPENLSDEDREYLVQRGYTNVADYADYQARQDAAAEAARIGSMSVAERLRYVANEAKRRAELTAADSQVVTEEVEEPYSKWKTDVLRDECNARGLNTEGNKADLVARLEQHDAAHTHTV